jgi:NADH dehydrogenase
MTEAQARSAQPHRVVIVGAGFGGLEAAFRLSGTPVSITLVDRRNHHLFQPLLYQVATASLATSEIAWPIRYLLRDRPEVTTLFATVTGVDAAAKRVLLDDGDGLPYDTLILATGARHAYFGHDEWEPFAPGLKTLEDATTLRRRILVAFERAERETDPRRRDALLTFVIIGAGPTGVELAGTIAELAQDTLPPDFRNIDTHKARVVLIEAGPRVLAGFADDLSAYAQRSLENIGVEVKLGQAVTECTADSVVYGWIPEPSSGLPACAPRPPPSGSAHRLTAPAACRSCPTSRCPIIPTSSPSAIPLLSMARMENRSPALRRRPNNRDAMSLMPSRRA